MANRSSRAHWIAAATLVPLLVLALARLAAHDAALPLVWANAVTPWIYLPAWLVLGYALWRRRGRLGVAAAFVVALHLVWTVPALTAHAVEPPSSAPRLRVVTANLLAVNDRPRELIDELARLDADVLVLEEVSPRWLGELTRSELWERYPHRELEVRADAFGIALLSRRPLSRASIVDLLGVPMIDATVQLGGRPVRVLGVHTLPPVDAEYAAVWRAQLALLHEHVLEIEEPLVVAGDVNATMHAAGMRALREAGLRDVHDELGRGLATTWPNGVFSAPSLRLDHVMVSEGLLPVAVREGQGAGSDHLPVVADLALVRAR